MKIETPKKTKQASENQMLINSLDIMKKIKNNDNFASIVNSKILSSLDTQTKSSVSNADLSAKTKKAASTAASAFIVADSYNAVMLETQGEDNELAVQKAKERTIQRIVRIVYGACIIKLFNDIFARPYNESLLGAQVVNVANTFLLETMERKSVGLPLHAATREEVIETEERFMNAKGITGSVGRFMAMLTGKRLITQENQIKAA